MHILILTASVSLPCSFGRKRATERRATRRCAEGGVPRRWTGHACTAGGREVSIVYLCFLFYYAHIDINSLRLLALLLWQEESDVL